MEPCRQSIEVEFKIFIQTERLDRNARAFADGPVFEIGGNGDQRAFRSQRKRNEREKLVRTVAEQNPFRFYSEFLRQARGELFRIRRGVFVQLVEGAVIRFRNASGRAERIQVDAEIQYFFRFAQSFAS